MGRLSVALIESDLRNVMKKIEDEYFHDRRYKIIDDKTNVFRGRAKSYAEKFEDVFACMLINILPDYKILVDFPISLSNGEREKTIILYPDILLLDKNRDIAGIIELKANLGWAEYSWYEDTKEKMARIVKALNVKCHNPFEGNRKKKMSLRMCTSPYYSIIVLHDICPSKKIQSCKDKDDCFILAHESKSDGESYREGDITKLANSIYKHFNMDK